MSLKGIIMSRYNSNIFQIPPRSGRQILKYDAGIFPSTHYDYYVFNAGRTTVLAEAWYGTKISWIGVVDGKVLEPGEECWFNVSDRPYYVTGVKICNRGDYRALVHCSRSDGYNLTRKGSESNPTLDITKIAKIHVKYGVKKVASIRDDLKSIIGFFWPNKKESVWDKLYQTISHLLDENIHRKIQKVLIEDILRLNESLRRLDYDISTLTHPSIVANTFMRLVESFFYFEKKFCVYNNNDSNSINANYHLLPLYSAAVNFNVTFYTFGITHPKAMGLNDEHISRLISYTQKLTEDPILGAIAHVNTIFEKKFKLEYETCDTELLYDTFATVRTYCGINGTEFISFWRNRVENPHSKNFDASVITYSTSFGRPTPYQAKQLLSDDVPLPLHPRIFDGKMSRIRGVTVGVWRQNSSQGRAKIEGMDVVYENGDRKQIGRITRECNYIDFKNVSLRKLVAWGADAVECLEFHFSNHRMEKVGSRNDNDSTKREFELEDHSIVGFYMSNDVPGSQGQAANISVSFQVEKCSNI